MTVCQIDFGVQRYTFIRFNSAKFVQTNDVKRASELQSPWIFSRNVYCHYCHFFNDNEKSLLLQKFEYIKTD